MVWGAKSFVGKTDLVVINDKLNLAYYTRILKAALLPIVDYIVEEDWILQQENAAVHTLRHTS